MATTTRSGPASSARATASLAAAGYASDRFRKATLARTPVRRWAEPDEMGPPAVYLADPTLAFHTGDALVVDGGYTVF